MGAKAGLMGASPGTVMIPMPAGWLRQQAD